jgi:hypothetical protein
MTYGMMLLLLSLNLMRTDECSLCWLQYWKPVPLGPDLTPWRVYNQPHCVSLPSHLPYHPVLDAYGETTRPKAVGEGVRLGNCFGPWPPLVVVWVVDEAAALDMIHLHQGCRREGVEVH